ncbi:MAG: TonB-dependent receptor plug domain-containing protein [Bacteroidetes bacterium]|nr:TonB-dependent receptor plug domain-containing protein [Bacteroidota bacterium]
MKSLQALVLLLAFTCFSSQVIAQAKANTLTQGTYKTIFEMLRDVPGLEVQLSNDKSGGSITIRGITSLKNQRPPLFVIDGSIYGGDITNINPQDVDGISVLKDAASTGAYGAQGAFGVIVITTKNGKGVVARVAVVESHTGSAYTYFIEHKTQLLVYGLNDEIIVKGVILKQRDSSLVFMVKRKELLVPISSIKRVEMVPE